MKLCCLIAIRHPLNLSVGWTSSMLKVRWCLPRLSCHLTEMIDSCSVETRCQQMTHHLDQLVMTLSCHYGTQMLKLPKTVKQMKLRDFVAKYGSDIEDVSSSFARQVAARARVLMSLQVTDDALRAMLSQYDVDPMPVRQPLAPLSVSKHAGIQKLASAKKDASKASSLTTPGKGSSSVVPATSAYSKWSQRLSSVAGATPVRAASTYGSSGSNPTLSWSSIKARLPKKGDQILYVSIVFTISQRFNISADHPTARPLTTSCPTQPRSCCSTKRTTSRSSWCRRAPSSAWIYAIRRQPRV